MKFGKKKKIYPFLLVYFMKILLYKLHVYIYHDLLQIAVQDFMDVFAIFPVTRGYLAGPVLGIVLRSAL